MQVKPFRLLDLHQVKAGSVAYALIQIPVTMRGVVLMDKSGRRALFLVPPLTFKKSKQNYFFQKYQVHSPFYQGICPLAIFFLKLHFSSRVKQFSLNRSHLLIFDVSN